MKNLNLLLLCFISINSIAQTLYYPPTNSDEWETIDPSTLSWCEENIDELYGFLEEKNTKAFLIFLKTERSF
jgi:Holliday junction resolvasome RuvABC DNA-binding subunit